MLKDPPLKKKKKKKKKNKKKIEHAIKEKIHQFCDSK